jgi:two-component system sensor histidine kinase VanS
LGGEPTHLVIANSGPEFTDEQVQSFLVPFRRGTAERTGSSTGQGLGLAIAAAIAEAHRATLTLAPREGGGLQVEVDFPPAPRCEWTGQ